MSDSRFLLHRFLHVLEDSELRQIDTWHGDEPDSRSRENLIASISSMSPDALNQTVPNLLYEPSLCITWQSVITWHERELTVSMNDLATTLDGEGGLEDLSPGTVLPVIGKQAVHEASNVQGDISLKMIDKTKGFALPRKSAGLETDNWIILRVTGSEINGLVVYNGKESVATATRLGQNGFLDYKGPFTHWEALGDAKDTYKVEGKMRGKWLPSG